ncbi:MAG: hypothetical protein WEB04_01380 [Dehalococcoidia bacterium]
MIARRMLLSAAFLMMLAIGALASASPVSAETATFGIDHNGGAPNINPGPAIVVEGGDVTVALVTVAPPSELGSWTVNIAFDSAVLDATACDTNPAIPQACNPDHALGVRLAGADSTGVSGTVDLMDMTFEAVGNAGDCSALVPNVEVLTDPLENSLDSAVNTGQVCIVQCADFNDDGRVTLADGVRLLIQILLRRPYLATFDLDADGDVDGRDFLVWQRQYGTSC